MKPRSGLEIMVDPVCDKRQTWKCLCSLTGINPSSLIISTNSEQKHEASVGFDYSRANEEEIGRHFLTFDPTPPRWSFAQMQAARETLIGHEIGHVVC